MHRGSFIRGSAVQVLIRDGNDAIHVTHLEPHLIFDADHLAESDGALRRIWNLDHKGRLPIMAIRDKGVVGAELLFNAFSFKYSLDAKHFLDLIANRCRIFKVEPHVLTKGQLSVFFVRHNLCAEVCAPG